MIPNLSNPQGTVLILWKLNISSEIYSYLNMGNINYIKVHSGPSCD